MTNIIIFGTGSVAAELTSYLEDSNWGREADITIKGYLASDEQGIINWGNYNFNSPFLGMLDDYNIQEEDYFILALSNPKVKSKIAIKIKSKGGKFINLIHPTSTIASSAKIGEGNIICPFVVLGPKVVIGDFNLFTSQSAISHDSVIGDFNFFSSSIICGHTSIGDNNYFGVRSTTIPSIHIGNRNVIQAGMVLDKDIQDDDTVFYRYKEKVMIINKD